MLQIQPITVTAVESLPQPSDELAKDEDIEELDQETLSALEEIFDDQIWISWTRERSRRQESE